MWLGTGFLILSIITAIVMTIIYKRIGTETGKSKKKKKSEDGIDEAKYILNKKDKNELIKLIGIKKIKDNLITLIDNNFRSVLSISSPDFELLTDDEQSTFENALMRFALSLNFPVQFFTTTIKIETKEPVKMIENFINSDEEMELDKLKSYASKLKEQLEAIENERGVHVRQSFCITGTDNVYDEKRMIMELKNRNDTIAAGLSAARMKVNRLNSKRIAQLLSDYFNKHSNANIDKLINDGALELYSEGLGVVIYNVNEEEK